MQQGLLLQVVVMCCNMRKVRMSRMHHLSHTRQGENKNWTDLETTHVVIREMIGMCPVVDMHAFD
jgi:hypothetical protein